MNDAVYAQPSLQPIHRAARYIASITAYLVPNLARPGDPEVLVLDRSRFTPRHGVTIRATRRTARIKLDERHHRPIGDWEVNTTAADAMTGKLQTFRDTSDQRPKVTENHRRIQPM